MKRKNIDKKISPYDKFQALRWKPAYRNDYWDFFCWCRENSIDEAEYFDHPEATKKAEELCKKYGITYLFNPSTDIPKHWGDKYFNDEKATVEVLYPTDYRGLTEDEIEKGLKPLYLPIPVFKNGDELIIKIELRADKEVILNKIIEQLDNYLSFIPRNKTRITPDRKVDKWEVFDMYNQTKSFYKIAKKLQARAASNKRIYRNFGIAIETPPKLDVSTIRKAYYRAFELVYEEKFDPEKHKLEKLTVELRRSCDKCPEQSTCEALCPQVLEYADQGSKASLRGLVSGEGISNIPDPLTDPEGICPKPATLKGLKESAVADKNLSEPHTTCEKCGMVYFPETKRDRKCPFCN